MDRKISNLLATSICILAIQLISLWSVDISVSAMINGGYVTNGLFNADPIVTYHFALYVLILTAFLQVIIFLHAKS